ncbi:ATPase family AAA domain-containing protein 5-like [Macrobrachium nipponense]|uniref:ATPase family AAA domain-containing protein 5-like n=1 Tax=Macrobrachium nipponense TaxID=159736 RepID=UPI0030C7FE8C
MENPLPETKTLLFSTEDEDTHEGPASQKTTAEKLAPIFCRRPKSPEIEVLKTAFSPSKLKARQEFLQSGVPEQIKKQQLLEKSQEEQLILSAPFPEFSHIQQRDDSDPIWNLHSPMTLSLKEEAENDLPKYRCTSIYQENIFNKTKPLESSSSLTESTSHDVTSVVVILNALKKNNPRFPVFSTFKLYLDQKKEAVESYKRELGRDDKISLIDLEEEETKSDKRKRRSKDGLSRRGRKKKGSGKTTRRSEEMQEIEEMPPLPVWQERIPNVWTQVYAPKKGSHVIGNKCHVKKLRRWLKDWKSKSEAFAAKERNKNARLSKKGDDDFTLSEESSSDEEDFVSTYLLCGPPGVGKTAVVYALAAELGYNVLEVNASSKRPGKHVMSQLAEATQSHSVSNSSNQPTNALAAMFAAKSGTQSKKVKNKAFASKEKVSHGCNRDVEKKKGLSVVLFEDIDIVFEESDEGFLSTVNNFMITTKRPIILTLSYPSHSALSKIKSSYERLDFEPPPEDLIGFQLALDDLSHC